MKFIFENGDEVKLPNQTKKINENIDELKLLFPVLVDNKHIFEFLNLNKDGE